MDAGLEITGEEPFNYFMTLFYPADNLLVLDYNRVIKSMNDMTPEQFRTALEEDFEVRPLADGETSRVERRHTYSLYLENKWYKMAIKEEKIDHSTPTTRLDSQIVTDRILNRILGIEDIKRDPRIDFVGGIRGH